MNNKNKHIFWTLFWIGLTFCFNFFVFIFKGPQAGIEFLTAYTLEKVLSLDNLFVFYLIFTSLKIPSSDQRKILYLGILGAVILRGLFIFTGVALIQRFQFLTFILGFVILITGIRFLFTENVKSQKKLPFSLNQFKIKNKFWTAIILVELNDLIFAIDSVPAALSVSKDPFIIYSSNIFAILGLRSLYFLLATQMKKLSFIKIALALIMIFIGVKMSVSHWIHIPTWISFISLFGILTFSYIFEFYTKSKSK